MQNEMVYVIAEIEVTDGRREEFLEQFRKIVPLVREEQGCRQYVPVIDVPTNIAAGRQARENVVTVIEHWDSLEALEAHLVAPHMIDYRAQVKHLVVQASLSISQPA